MRRGAAVLALWVPVATLLGCQTPRLLTRSQVRDSRWSHYADVRSDFDRIVPLETTGAEARALGFGPDTSVASQVVTYVEVVRTFAPHEGIPLENADPAVQYCVHVRERCTVWQIDVNRLRRRRVGNLALDWLLFRRIRRTTGWNFEALILLENDLVLYTIWRGVPSIRVVEDLVQPLGLLQEFFSLIPPRSDPELRRGVRP